MLSSPSFSRRTLLKAVGVATMAAAWPSLLSATSSPRRLRLAGPPAPVSFPLMQLAAHPQLLEHLNIQVSFRLWSNPDQLRAMVIQENVDLVALPTNVAANLYNRGAPLRLLDVSNWGLLWLVSRQPRKQTLADFRGEEITVPFRADMPDIMFQYLARQQGLDPERDFRIRYVGTPFEAMQLLVTRRTSHALLSEPAVSMALQKTRTFPVNAVAPMLYRSVDLQKEWGRLLQRPPEIPMAGIAVVGEAFHDRALLNELDAVLAHAYAACRVRSLACGADAKRYAPMLLSEAVADALEIMPDKRLRAHEARPELDFFYTQLMEQQPGLVGGKLPDDAFYL